MLEEAWAGFDVVVEETYPVWVKGGTVVRGGEEVKSGKELKEEMEREGVTVAEVSTAYWEEMVEEQERSGEVGRGLRQVIVGCEGVKREKYEKWKKGGVRLVHVYGLTETTVTTTVSEGEEEEEESWEQMVIGRVVGNASVYVKDEEGEEVGEGMVGELYIGGVGLGRGYVNQADE